MAGIEEMGVATRRCRAGDNAAIPMSVDSSRLECVDPFRLWPLFGTHANRQFPVVIIDLRTSLMFWSRRLGQLPCGEWGEFCNGLRRYSSAAITTALPQVMVERNDAKEGDAMGEKRDIKETASLFGRRSALVLGTISATALFGPLGGAALAQGTGGIKLTLLFTPPKDPVASTKYYLETHVPLVSKTPGVKRVDVAAVLPPPPGQPVPPYCRITEIYFDDIGALQTGLGSPEWKTVVADVPNFADPSSITGFASLIGA